MKKALIALILLLPSVAYAQTVTNPAEWNSYSSAALEASNKKAAKMVQYVCAVNTSTTDEVLMVFDLATASCPPADGAVTPIACAPIPKATATLPGAGCWTPPIAVVLTNGLCFAASTGDACFTKTISGSVNHFIAGYHQ